MDEVLVTKLSLQTKEKEQHKTHGSSEIVNIATLLPMNCIYVASAPFSLQETLNSVDLLCENLFRHV